MLDLTINPMHYDASVLRNATLNKIDPFKTTIQELFKKHIINTEQNKNLLQDVDDLHSSTDKFPHLVMVTAETIDPDLEASAISEVLERTKDLEMKLEPLKKCLALRQAVIE